jgi:hypothetical protein
MNQGVDLSRDGVAYFRTLVETIPVAHNTPTPVPDPTPDPIDLRPITITGYRAATQTPNHVNIRDMPSGTIVGILPASPVVTSGYVSLNKPVSSNGYMWQYYELDIENTVSGYIAEEFVTEIIKDEPPPVEDDVIEMSKSDFDTIVAILEKYHHA